MDDSWKHDDEAWRKLWREGVKTLLTAMTAATFLSILLLVLLLSTVGVEC